MTLTLDHIAFERSNQCLFHSVCMTLNPGELLQISGANGSGKSTLLRIIAGYIEPQQGKVIWQLEDFREDIHYLGHQNGLKPFLTVIENLKLTSALNAKKFTESALHEVLQQMEIKHLAGMQTLYLSAGQKRRLALARLLLNPRKIWILDEPTTALDSSGLNLLTHLLETHLKNNGIVVTATHHELSIRAEIKKINLTREEVSYA